MLCIVDLFVLKGLNLAYNLNPDGIILSLFKEIFYSGYTYVQNVQNISFNATNIWICNFN